MNTDHGPWLPALEESAESHRIPTPVITTIRREQMPEDLRSEFLPEDVILLCLRSRHSSTANSTPSQARRTYPLLAPKCPWCVADEVCAGIIVIPIALLCLIFAFIKNRETLAVYVFKYVVAALSGMMMFLTLVLVHIQCGSNIRDSVNLRCPRGVRFHCTHNLMGRLLSPGSLLLLQQPKINFRSFFRYCKFFNGKAGGPADPDVDRCIRAHVAAGTLPQTGLINYGSHALLGLAPSQDILVDFGWSASHLNVLYRTYRDWKRWRLAALVCEQLQGRNGKYPPRQDLDDSRPGSPLGRLGNDCGHKWFLVDLQMFPSLPPPQL